MSNYIVIDTDILIDAAHELDKAINCLKQLERQFALAVSIVTRMELIVGCRNKRELKLTESFLKRFIVINLNEDIALNADKLLLQYRLSHGLLIPDALIAATAITLDYPLISKNQKDYRFIQNLTFLPYD
ncbi:MAG: PIN domain protein [Candidatus Magnetoglobus multicellularis str. Araruama]|uniref:Ribonuclease VapC n=1 Tax=Candidatus Magnetoglobus multicellularis str. Araruama TaxID=890399 RepID=A0A1V1NTE5_9BACT|nr:MAG: PIN domain protein [Candidatus Magnetoglobus multicellularis str. Araruama]